MMTDLDAVELEGYESEGLEAVYFVQAGPEGPIKIGVTGRSVAERIAQLQVGCPEELRLLWVSYSVEARELERQLHRRFAAYRVRGEWYRPEVFAQLWDWL